MLSPRTVEQIEALATEMAGMFLPPELIVGCEVLSVADKDQYAANNGWIEARVGRHNQQRCRWRGQFANVQVGGFVDVLFFASYRLFVVLGQGGTGAISSGGGWPFTDTKTLDPTDPDADYSTLASAITGMTAGQRLAIGTNLALTASATINKALSLCGYPGVTITSTADVLAYLSHASGILYMSDLILENTNAVDAARYVLNSTGVYDVFERIRFIIQGADASDRIAYSYGGTGQAELYNCEFEATSVASQVSYGVYASGGVIHIHGGRINVSGAGTSYAVYADSGCTIVLRDVIIESGLIGEFVAGSVQGTYIDANGDLVTLPNTKLLLGNGAVTPPLNVTARSATPSAPATGDTYLDDGTNTPSGNKNWLHYNGASWDELGDGGGAGGAQNFQLYHLGTAAEYATLALAVAAAVSGDSIVVYPGAHTTDDVTIPDGVNLIVVDPENTTFSTSTSQYCIRTGAGSYLLNVRAQVTTSHATQVGAIYLAGNNSICENCTAIGSNSHASGFGYGFYKQGATGIELRNCRGDATATTANDNYGFRQDTTAGSVKIVGGEFKGDVADIYVLGETIAVYNPILGQSGLINGNGVWSGDMPNCLVIKNTSGATPQPGDVGYIDYVASAGGEYKTTTTASDDKYPSACVVIGPGINNANILVQVSGKAKMQYVSTAPSAGDFLLFSTTAGALTRSATMHPNLVAIAQAAGSGGLVEALLMTKTFWVAKTSSVDVYSIGGHSSTQFVATINGAPTATSVVYNAPSAGAEDAIKPSAAGLLGKMRLHNTTRGTYRLIDNVNTATNTITTVSSTDAWASGDTIQAESITCVIGGGGVLFFDIDLSQQSVVPTLARALKIGIQHFDNTVNTLAILHPYTAYAGSNQVGPAYTADTSAPGTSYPIVQLINRAFCYRSQAGGSGTAQDYLRMEGYFVAAP